MRVMLPTLLSGFAPLAERASQVVPVRLVRARATGCGRFMAGARPLTGLDEPRRRCCDVGLERQG